MKEKKEEEKKPSSQRRLKPKYFATVVRDAISQATTHAKMIGYRKWEGSIPELASWLGAKQTT